MSIDARQLSDIHESLETLRRLLIEHGTIMRLDERHIPIYLGLAQACVAGTDLFRLYDAEELAQWVPAPLRDAVLIAAQNRPSWTQQPPSPPDPSPPWAWRSQMIGITLSPADAAKVQAALDLAFQPNVLLRLLDPERAFPGPERAQVLVTHEP